MPGSDLRLDEDWLRQRFAAVPVDDDGFSERVLRRVRHRSAVRRTLLSAAAAIGGALTLHAALPFLPPAGGIDWPSLSALSLPGNLTEWLYSHWSLALATVAAVASTAAISLLEH